MTDRTIFALGAVFGFLAVAAGAFGTHALESRLAPDRLATYDLAARYQIFHAFALLATAWAAVRWPSAGAAAAGWLFTAGVLIFCGTLYALAFGAPRWLGAVTPVGGLSLLGGWLALVWTALKG